MIRPIGPGDRDQYIAMCRDFYSGNAVSHPVPEEYFGRAFDEMTTSTAYLEGYILEDGGQTAGYMLFFQSYSQEAGGAFAFLDELYVKPAFRGRGLGREALAFARAQVDSGRWKRVRLEVTKENGRAAGIYRRAGYSSLPYEQMYIGE